MPPKYPLWRHVSYSIEQLLLPHCFSLLPPLVSQGLEPWGNSQPIRRLLMFPGCVNSGWSELPIPAWDKAGWTLLPQRRREGPTPTPPGWSPGSHSNRYSTLASNLLSPEGASKWQMPFIPSPPTPSSPLSLLLCRCVDWGVWIGQIYPWPIYHQCRSSEWVAPWKENWVTEGWRREELFFTVYPIV